MISRTLSYVENFSTKNKLKRSCWEIYKFAFNNGPKNYFIVSWILKNIKEG